MGSIQWTEETWNPVTGCSKVSAGCKNCYAEVQAKRLQKMGQPNYKDGFAVRCHPHMLERPINWKRPRKIFVNSMSDLFHQDVPLEFVRQVFDVMEACPHHQFQILTKRASRMRWFIHDKYGKKLPNVWLGVSVEDEKALMRIFDLRLTPAAVRFLSLEPLIKRIRKPNFLQAVSGNIGVSLWASRIHWAIVGGESGPKSRACKEPWVSELVEACIESEIAPFVKQMGTVWAKQNGAKHAKGGNPDEWPEHLRVREFPEVSQDA